ncbi:sensor histidine kinase [Desulfosediminicola sp.]|uniref:sensor histidine kinase n=1 Tax=Desulfosediminicola sp. TaxID=2886825 RepID=UPI003AF22344
MKIHSMRRHITLYLLGITALMTVIYGMLMNAYLLNGLEAAASFEMKFAAARFAQAYQKDPKTPAPRTQLIYIYLGREELPEHITEIFPKKNYKDQKLYIGYEFPDRAKDKTTDAFLFMPYELHDGKQLFVIKHFDQEAMQLVDPPDINTLRFMAIPLGIFCVLIVFLAVRAMLDKLYKPINKLTTWAGGLDPEGLSRPLPNFGYQEVNELGALLHSSMKGLADSLARERHFVRHASHELRTPLAVIQSNIELLTRMHPEIKKPESIPFERIRRATTNMNKTTETLLWLCLDDNRIPEPEAVALDVMARDLISENRYLLDGKQVDVELIFEPTQVSTIAYGARIAMGNLIRNSFQYTAEGTVRISVKNKSITVTNINRTSHHIDNIGSDYGYGLGLILVDQITQKTGWQYTNEEIPGGRRATIVFCCASNGGSHDHNDLIIPGFRNTFG